MAIALPTFAAHIGLDAEEAVVCNPRDEDHFTSHELDLQYDDRLNLLNRGGSKSNEPGPTECAAGRRDASPAARRPNEEHVVRLPVRLAVESLDPDKVTLPAAGQAQGSELPNSS